MPRRLVTPGAHWGARLCALLLSATVLALAALAAPSAAGTVGTARTDGASATLPGGGGFDTTRLDRPGPGAIARRSGPVVLVGVPGLLWEDVTRENTPTLWEMAEKGSIGNVSIRTATSRTCPTDGWLSVSAGQRALSIRERFTVCEAAPEPERDGSGAVVPGFGSYVRQNERSSFGAPVGLLGQTVRDAGGTTLAVGHGAALGVADRSGRVDHYVDGVHALTTERLEGVSLAAVELAELTRLYPVYPDPLTPGQEDGDANGNGGPVEAPGDGEEAEEPPEPDPDDVPEWERDKALSALDDRLRSLESVLPAGSSLMVVGVSMDTGPSQLTVALSGEITEDGFTGAESFLASESTRRAGLVVLTDTTPTLLTSLGMRATEPTSGRPWHLTGRPPTTDKAVGRLMEFNTAAIVVGAAIPGFFSGLVAFQLLIYAAAAYALHRYSNRQRGKRARVLSLTRIVALAGAAFPVASYLANLVPWWTSPIPPLALLVCVLSADALVVALAVAGPWRHTILGPMTVVAGATTVVLFLDLCFGADLQMNSPTGYSPIVAGRFYGIGNIAFATFATGMLMAVAGIAHELISRGRRRAAVVTTLVIGSATVLIVGWPGLGTDFGGVIALVPGLAVTTMMIAGIRVTPPRLAAVSAAAVAAIALMAWLDYLKPPQARSHFGAFAGQVVSGEAAAVVARKLSAMLGTLGNWQLTLLAGCALVFLFVVLQRPLHWRFGALQGAYEYAPTLRAGLTGSLLTALVGFAANDSGVAIPAIALTVAVPLTLSACVWALQRQDGDRAPGPEPAENAQRM
ncbi:hypothetical protein A6A08_00045 [Nocardiopsis sp. TSRI0078]|uniref:hypothetical protein n=1 Tax=unclassified Nocardiopsis TaxID=2649073 RepID=UPI00093B0937|nr:hypothetical protein [Nocardiopsis sp. TSRI0078]OKI23242.1 hypothetical protein A6A08_00045 [Nocardiopsis sp. TSRI0078]